MPAVLVALAGIAMAVVAVADAAIVTMIAVLVAAAAIVTMAAVLVAVVGIVTMAAVAVAVAVAAIVSKLEIPKEHSWGAVCSCRTVVRLFSAIVREPVNGHGPRVWHFQGGWKNVDFHVL